MKKIAGNKNLPFLAFFSLLVALGLIYLAPPEKSLGSAVRLVFLHAALMWVAFGLVTIQGLTSLTTLFLENKPVQNFTSLALIFGLALFLITGLLGLITAFITWGGVNWTEPRLFMLGQILLLGLIVVGINELARNLKLVSLVRAGFALVVWFLVLKTELVIHPANPIFSSSSLTFKAVPVLAALLLAVASLSLIFYYLLTD